MLTPKRTEAAEQRVIDVLVAAGFREHEGWFFPAGDPDRAAVRLTVYSGQYQIWRRRRLSSAWMMIAVSDVEDFDPAAFETWRSAWPLTH